MKKHWMILLGVLLLAGGGYFGWKKWRPSKAPVRTAVVEQGDLQIQILSTGLVQPENRIEIKPPIAGRVESVLAEEGQRVRRGQILAWMSSTERAALLDAARAKGADELAHWEDLYKATPMVAPLDGTIIARNVEAGQTVTSADSVYVLSDRLIVKVDVDETDIGRVRVGMPASFTLDSFPQTRMNGRVSQIAQESRTVNNVTTYQIYVLPQTVPPYMKSGMTTNVSFLGESREAVWKVPAEAIRRSEGKSWVSIVDPQHPKKPQQREVQTGLSDGKQTEITEGLSGGETLVIPTLRQGQGEEKVNPLGMQRPRGRGTGTR